MSVTATPAYLRATKGLSLGGFGTGEPVDAYTIIGVVAEGNDALQQRLGNTGVKFQREEHQVISSG